jgi:hypothetical protein
MWFTAIYSTKLIKNIHYSFKANGAEEAISFAKHKFANFPEIKILQNEEDGKADEGKLIFLNGTCE